MKTPDEIKKGLEVCATLDGDCENCPYDDGKRLACADRSRKDALAYIIQLESRLAQVERERDAAVRDLTLMAWNADEGIACFACGSDSPLRCEYCKNRPEEAFVWRGVCEKNTKDGADA